MTSLQCCGLPSRYLIVPILLAFMGGGLFLMDLQPSSCPFPQPPSQPSHAPTQAKNISCPQYNPPIDCCNCTQAETTANLVVTPSQNSDHRLSRVIVLFFATGISDLLCNALEMALEWGVTVRVIGLDPAGSHFDVKTDRIVNGVDIVAATLSPSQVNETLFVALDWDVILQCNEVEWLDVFHRAVEPKARRTSLLFSGEKNIFTPEWLLFYAAVGNRDAYQMPFLNSGAFMGTADAFRRAGARYRLYPNPQNKLIDQHIWQNLFVDYTMRTGLRQTTPLVGPGFDTDQQGRSLSGLIRVDYSGRLAFSMCPVPVVEPRGGGIVSGVHVIEHRIDNGEAFRFGVDAPFHHVIRLFNFEWQWDVLRVNESTGHIVAEVSPPNVVFRPCILHFNGRAKGDDGKRGRNPRSYHELVHLRRTSFYRNRGINRLGFSPTNFSSFPQPGVWHDQNIRQFVRAFHSSGTESPDFVSRLLSTCKENGPMA